MRLEERWRSYLGDYAVSDYGRVRNIRTGRMMKLRIDDRGYVTWSMHFNGSPRPFSVHRAVLECFVGPPPDGHVARHLNGDKVDNRLENLAWGTPAQNVADAIRHGRHARGEQSGRAKLTELAVREIRESNEPGIVLARRFGVTNTTITYIRKRKNWAHVD